MKPSVISEIWEQDDGKQGLEKGCGGRKGVGAKCMVGGGLDGQKCFGINKRFQYESQGPY